MATANRLAVLVTLTMTLLLPGCVHATTPPAPHPLTAWAAAAEHADTAPARIVWLGDSTSYGSNATVSENRYVNQATTRIQAARGGTKPVVNLGDGWPQRDNTPGVQAYLSAAGGANSETYINDVNLPFIIWQQPSLVVHMIGYNDSIDVEPYAVPVDEYQANVAAAIDAIDDGSTQPVSHVLFHIFRHTGVTPENWDAYRAALEEIAAGRDNVLVVDISQPYYDLDYLGTDPQELIDTDMVHQTNTGHAFMGELVAAALLDLPVTPTPTTNPTTTATPVATPTPTQSPTTQPTPGPTPTVPVTPELPPVTPELPPVTPTTPAAAEHWATVIRAIDGDTIRVRDAAGRHTLRLDGINAPRRGACGSTASTRALRRTLPRGTDVLLDDRQVLKNGRVDVVRRQLTKGHTRLDQPATAPRAHRVAQRRAKAAGLGLWSC